MSTNHTAETDAGVLNGNAPAAIADQATAADPGPSAAHHRRVFDDVHRRVRALYELGRVSDARRLVEGHLRQSTAPDDAILNDLGVILVEAGDVEAALNCFTRALQTHTLEARATVLANLAFALFVENRRHAALKFCARALDADPGETRAHYLMSVAENMLYGGQCRAAPEVIHDSAGVRLFRALRLWGEPMRKIRCTALDGRERLLLVHEPAAVSRAGMHWGVLHHARAQLWCGFTQQSCAGGADQSPPVDMPARMHLVQRRNFSNLLRSKSWAAELSARAGRA